MRPFFTSMIGPARRFGVAATLLTMTLLPGGAAEGASSVRVGSIQGAKTPSKTQAKTSAKSTAKSTAKSAPKSTSKPQGKTTAKKSTRRPARKPAPPKEPPPKLGAPYSADTITVGTASATRGTRVEGVLSPTGENAPSIALTVIHGAQPGPVVAYISSAPSADYSSAIALSKLPALIDPAKVSGTLIIVPQMSTGGVAYPGDPTGSADARLVALVSSQIIARADVVVDIHAGDPDVPRRPYGQWTRTGVATQDKAGRSLALAFGLDMIVVRDIDVRAITTSRDLGDYALSRGKNTLDVESGGAGKLTSSESSALIAGCMNILGAIQVITRAVGMDGKVAWIGADQAVTASDSGTFAPEVERGNKVRKGEKLGTLTDARTGTARDVLAPRDGIVTFIRGAISVSEGATLVTVALNHGTTPPPYSTPRP